MRRFEREREKVSYAGGRNESWCRRKIGEGFVKGERRVQSLRTIRKAEVGSHLLGRGKKSTGGVY